MNFSMNEFLEFVESNFCNRSKNFMLIQSNNHTW